MHVPREKTGRWKEGRRAWGRGPLPEGGNAVGRRKLLEMVQV